MTLLLRLAGAATANTFTDRSAKCCRISRSITEVCGTSASEDAYVLVLKAWQYSGLTFNCRMRESLVYLATTGVELKAEAWRKPQAACALIMCCRFL